MSFQFYSRILVTGGAGFMGSSFVRYLLKSQQEIETLVVLDLLTYAGNLSHLEEVAKDPRYHFVRGDICHSSFIEGLLRLHRIEAIVHFAAESHVDRSIEDPRIFYRTNVEGTLVLLEILRRYPDIHFHHISTDEVYGSAAQGQFTEDSPYRPNSPYAASKAAADHFVRSYAHTYGLSVTLSHASNNFGPCQYKEKFIPKMISHCLLKKPLPIYGKGENIRNWLFVDDHSEAVWRIIQKGKRGESYNIGGKSEWVNMDLLKFLIEKVARAQGESSKIYQDLILLVEDRPGHDFRYSLSSEKLEKEVQWSPKVSFESGIDKTIEWYTQYVRQ